jgi:guanosine-3',5'-bis(diphosphate) 3'-pyrophosphohydrolase
MSQVAELLAALSFAAEKHRDQRRKGDEKAPYINHVIEVVELLARTGIDDRATLLAAALHDTVEDTDTTPDDIEQRFGSKVREVVMEVTDDKSLPKAERKRLQIEHAPNLSREARRIKLADKISNVRSIAETPPSDWAVERRLAYFDWADAVVAGLRGSSPELEALYDETVVRGRASLS